MVSECCFGNVRSTLENGATGTHLNYIHLAKRATEAEARRVGGSEKCKGSGKQNSELQMAACRYCLKGRFGARILL